MSTETYHATMAAMRESFRKKLPGRIADVEKAMSATKARTKAEAITIALESIVKQEKYNQLLAFHGKVTLDIDLDTLRKR